MERVPSKCLKVSNGNFVQSSFNLSETNSSSSSSSRVRSDAGIELKYYFVQTSTAKAKRFRNSFYESILPLVKKKARRAGDPEGCAYVLFSHRGGEALLLACPKDAHLSWLSTACSGDQFRVSLYHNVDLFVECLMDIRKRLRQGCSSNRLLELNRRLYELKTFVLRHHCREETAAPLRSERVLEKEQSEVGGGGETWLEMLPSTEIVAGAQDDLNIKEGI